MAVTIPVLRVIKQVVEAHAAAGPRPRRALALGYPDILASPAWLAEVFGAQRMAGVALRPDSAEVIRWHGETGRLEAIVDAFDFFKAIGYALEVADIAEIRGGERILDLNLPCDPALHRQYDLVIDGGTLEHCFNIGQAARNVAEMVGVGGHVLHVNPMSMFNHGFYNLNPTWYADFYQDNGFELRSLQVSVLRRPDVLQDIPPYQRIQQLPMNAMLIALVRRVSLKPIAWPVQMKYRHNPSLKA